MARSLRPGGTRPLWRPGMGVPARPSMASSMGRPCAATMSSGNATRGDRNTMVFSHRSRTEVAAGASTGAMGGTMGNTGGGAK